MMAKGATKFDILCHKVFAANGNGTDYLSRETGVRCGYCGCELQSYYCESRLYLVECPKCKTRALVMAHSAKEAAYKTFGHAVLPLDEMGEELAVFFHHTPIDEPPSYVGSTIDCDFPDDVVCGMYLPCVGTDGAEVGGYPLSTKCGMSEVVGNIHDNPEISGGADDEM